MQLVVVQNMRANVVEDFFELFVGDDRRRRHRVADQVAVFGRVDEVRAHQ